MKRNVAGLVIVFVGAAVLQLAISGSYLRYVKPGMHWMLLAAGAALVLLAVADVFRSDEKHDDGHGHHGLPRVAWLLLVPIVALLVVDPPALGADAAARQSPVAARPVTAPKGSSVPADTGAPVQLAVRDYSVWAVWEQDSMRGRSFRLTGFATPGKGGVWYLTRIGITCCVADASAFMVQVHGEQAPPKNQWVELTGTWAAPVKNPDGDIAAIDATGMRVIAAPANPYE